MSKIADEFKSFGNFLRECRAEVGKITWPPRKQLVESTWVVGALILMLSVFVFVCDRVLRWGVVVFAESVHDPSSNQLPAAAPVSSMARASAARSTL